MIFFFFFFSSFATRRCIPSKALLNASHKYHELHANLFEQFGVKVSGVSLDLPKMMKQKDDAVTSLTGGIEYLFKKNGVKYFKVFEWQRERGGSSLTENCLKGKGSFTSPKSLAVALTEGGSDQIESKNFVIATGSDVMDLPGFCGKVVVLVELNLFFLRLQA